MSKRNLTETLILASKPRSKEYFLSDGNGLHLRIRPAGDKLWIFRYTNPLGKQSKVSVGPYPEIPLVLARKTARDHREKLALGFDPKLARDDAPTTVSELFELWVTQELPKRRVERNVYQTRLRFKKHILPHLGDSSLPSITKRDLLAVLNRLTAKGFNAQANLLLREVRQMFDYAVTSEWLDFNRVKSISKNEVGGKDVIGSRILSKSEIKELWSKCNQETGITLQCHASIWLALSTMARIEEMLTAEERDFDLEKNLWTIPAHKNSSKREHTIHLSPFALRYIDMLLNTPREGSPYLFKSNRSKEYVLPKTINFQISHRQDCPDSLDQTSRLKPNLKSALRLSGGRWSHQDLRRSAAALMSSLRVPTEIIEQCLNHSPKSAHISIYQHKSQAEQRHAFNKLGKELEKLTQ